MEHSATNKQHSLAFLAQLTGSQLVGDPDHLISGVEDLETAGSQHASFFENARYERLVRSSHAGVIVVSPTFALVVGKNFLIHKCPSLAFQTIIELFIKQPQSGFSHIHPTAVIHETAILGENVTIGPHVVIDANAQIGSNTHLEAGVCIGPFVTIGSDCHFYSHVIIREGTQIGNRVVIQPGAVIGSCGFGYYTDQRGQHHSLKQLGTVVIEDDVEIGANTTIDRARFKITRIGRGTKIDNLVQIAHQVSLGEDNLIVSQVGIAGSTKTGKNVVMGGQVGVIGHISITNGVIIAARAAVSKSLEKPGIYSGAPAAPIREFNEQFVQLRSFPKFLKKFAQLEARLEELEKEKNPNYSNIS